MPLIQRALSFFRWSEQGQSPVGSHSLSDWSARLRPTSPPKSRRRTRSRGDSTLPMRVGVFVSVPTVRTAPVVCRVVLSERLVRPTVSDLTVEEPQRERRATVALPVQRALTCILLCLCLLPPEGGLLRGTELRDRSAPPAVPSALLCCAAGPAQSDCTVVSGAIAEFTVCLCRSACRMCSVCVSDVCRDDL